MAGRIPRSVVITGGTGSLGRSLTAFLLREPRTERVRIFSRDEGKHHQMRLDGFTDPRIDYMIGDVRDRHRIRMALRGMDAVVHAAALKQIPLVEDNPSEALLTNAVGSQVVSDEAAALGVTALAVSSDKAVQPLNVYGATKMLTERIFVRAGFNCVRYGNVANSRGSVVPVFMAQRGTGTVTVTDERMTRFWMTLDDAARVVASALGRPPAGEIVIPLLPSFLVMDLAEAVAPACGIVVTGIRPGEKLHETLLCRDEAPYSRQAGLYVLTPWRRPADALPEDFRYDSESNHWRLSPHDIRERLGLPSEMADTDRAITPPIPQRIIALSD